MLGPELGEKSSFLGGLKRELRASCSDSLEEDRFYLPETKVPALLQSISNPSLFSQRRLALYYGVEQLGAKADIKALAEFIRNMPADLCLVMLSDEVGADKALKDACGERGVKVFWEMYEDRKEEWIRSFFRRQGIKIQEDAVGLLLELVENNSEALGQECSRLAAFIGQGQSVDEALVANYITHNRSEDAFSLFARIAESGFPEALGVLNKILETKEGEPIGILAGLAWSFRRLETYLELLGSGMAADDAALRSGLRSKTLKAQYQKAGRRFNLEACRRVQALIVATDEALRSGQANMELCLLHSFLYCVMEKGGQGLETPPI